MGVWRDETDPLAEGPLGLQAAKNTVEFGGHSLGDGLIKLDYRSIRPASIETAQIQ